MPPPLALLPIGQYLSIAAAKRVAASAIVSVDTYTVSSAALAYILGLLAWRRIPEWIKEDVSIRNLLPKDRNKPDATSLELSTLASVIEKLQALLESGSAKLVSNPVPFLHAAILAYIQLAAHLHKLYPHDRDIWYKNCGTAASASHFENTNQDNSDFEFHEQINLSSCLDYATLSYESDTTKISEFLGSNFEVIQHNTLIKDVVRPGNVGHYLAVSKKMKLIVVGIRGTSSFEELLTDCCGQAVSYNGRDDYASENYDDMFHSREEVRAAIPNELLTSQDGHVEVISGHERIWMEAHNDDNGNDIRCHQGILICAIRLVNTIQAFVKEHVVDDEYRLLLCGHSLGAGVASIAAVVLRSRLPALADTTVTHKMKVVAFDPFLTQKKAEEIGVEKVELDELYKRADFITISQGLVSRYPPATPELKQLPLRLLSRFTPRVENELRTGESICRHPYPPPRTTSSHCVGSGASSGNSRNWTWRWRPMSRNGT